MSQTMDPKFLDQIHTNTPLRVLVQYAKNRRQEKISGEMILDELRARGVPIEKAIAAVKGQAIPEKPTVWGFLKLLLALVLVGAALTGMVLAFVNDVGNHKKLARTLFWLSIPATAGAIMLVEFISSRNSQNQNESADFEESK